MQCKFLAGTQDCRGEFIRQGARSVPEPSGIVCRTSSAASQLLLSPPGLAPSGCSKAEVPSWKLPSCHVPRSAGRSPNPRSSAIFVLLVFLVLVTYIPEMSLWLPRLLGML